MSCFKNKFYLLQPLVQIRVNIFIISDSKTGNSFLVQFEIPGYYTRYKFEDVPTKTLHVLKLATNAKIFYWAKLV